MHKTIVIGLDGVTYEFIELWRENIQVLEGMFKDFSSGILKSTIPSQTSVAMQSLLNSKNFGGRERNDKNQLYS